MRTRLYTAVVVTAIDDCWGRLAQLSGPPVEIRAHGGNDDVLAPQAGGGNGGRGGGAPVVRRLGVSTSWPKSFQWLRGEAGRGRWTNV